MEIASSCRGISGPTPQMCNLALALGLEREGSGGAPDAIATYSDPKSCRR